VTRKEGDLAAFKVAEHKRVRRLAEGRLHAHFAHVCESGHGVKSAAANNSNLSLSQFSFLVNGPISDPQDVVGYLSV
jgi:hypothetical protein